MPRKNSISEFYQSLYIITSLLVEMVEMKLSRITQANQSDREKLSCISGLLKHAQREIEKAQIKE